MKNLFALVSLLLVLIIFSCQDKEEVAKPIVTAPPVITCNDPNPTTTPTFISPIGKLVTERVFGKLSTIKIKVIFKASAPCAKVGKVILELRRTETKELIKTFINQTVEQTGSFSTSHSFSLDEPIGAFYIIARSKPIGGKVEKTAVYHFTMMPTFHELCGVEIVPKGILHKLERIKIKRNKKFSVNFAIDPANECAKTSDLSISIFEGLAWDTALYKKLTSPNEKVKSKRTLTYWLTFPKKGFYTIHVVVRKNELLTNRINLDFEIVD